MGPVKTGLGYDPTDEWSYDMGYSARKICLAQTLRGCRPRDQPPWLIRLCE
ncbi:hypothetical protein E2C01_089974 [Portunus trituberculatus]|uniref:Uncharacterized protein n=1 Tax=Portunus trituberculatus TaxID=210409 RepID=A0A5B7JNW9_PORTR|nr:hypothetical protein [Portunus trituberculatus]